MKRSPLDATELLRTAVLPALWRRAPYASVPAVRRALAGARARVRPATVNRYLHELLQEGAVFDAGRGWYSTLKEAVHLSPEPVTALVAEVRKAFPLLRLAAWSSAQVNPWMHHLIGQPVAVLNVERDALDNVAEHLEAANWKPALNPTGAAARRFAPRPKSVVLRPLHSMAPQAPDGLASPEQVLVELRLEADALGLMAAAEFQAMATRLALGGRLTVGTLLRYTKRRGLSVSDLFENQLMAVFEESTID